MDKPMLFTLDRAALEAKRKDLADNHGVELVGDNGQVTARGATIKYSYTEANKQLSLQMIDHPPMMDGYYTHLIQSWVAGS